MCVCACVYVCADVYTMACMWQPEENVECGVLAFHLVEAGSLFLFVPLYCLLWAQELPDNFPVFTSHLAERVLGLQMQSSHAASGDSADQTLVVSPS